jgi:hypothetical protein
MPSEMMIRKLRVHSKLSEDDMSALRTLHAQVKEFPEETVVVRRRASGTLLCDLEGALPIAPRWRKTASGRSSHSTLQGICRTCRVFYWIEGTMIGDAVARSSRLR